MERFPLPPLLAGIAASVLFAASVATLVGPTAGDSAAQVADELSNGRDLLLAAVLGSGIWAALGLWFLSALGEWLRRALPDAGRELGSLAASAGALAIGLALVGISLFYGATYALADGGGSEALLGLVHAANAAMMLTKFAAAALIAAASVAISRSAVVGGWFAALGYVSVAALIASTVGLVTTDSFTEFGGPLDFYSVLPAAAWGVALMNVLYRGREPGGAAR